MELRLNTTNEEIHCVTPPNADQPVLDQLITARLDGRSQATLPPRLMISPETLSFKPENLSLYTFG